MCVFTHKKESLQESAAVMRSLADLLAVLAMTMQVKGAHAPVSIFNSVEL